MATRSNPTATAHFHAHGSRYAFDVWPPTHRYCHLADEFRQGLWKSNMIDTVAKGVTYACDSANQRYVSAAQAIGAELDVVICRPFMTQSSLGGPEWLNDINPPTTVAAEEDIESDAFDVSGADVDVEDIDDYALDQTTMRQRNVLTSAGTPVVSEWTSKFKLSPNPFFAVTYERQRPTDDQAWSSMPGLTVIRWGFDTPQGAPANGWALVLPYDEGAYLCHWEYDDTAGQMIWKRVDWTQGNLTANVEKGTLWIGTIAGAICVSTESFQDDFAWYRPTQTSDYLTQASRVFVRHTCGQLVMRFSRLKMFPAELQRTIYTGYDGVYIGGALDTSVCVDASGMPNRCAYGIVPPSSAYDPVVELETDASTYVSNRPGRRLLGLDGSREFQWPDTGTARVSLKYGSEQADVRVRLVPRYYSHTFAAGVSTQTVTTYTSPGVQAVEIYGRTAQEDTGQVAIDASLSCDNGQASLQVTDGGDGVLKTASLVVDNRWWGAVQGQFHAAAVGLLRLISVDNVGWYWSDGGWERYREMLYSSGSYIFDPDTTLWDAFLSLDAQPDGPVTVLELGDWLTPLTRHYNIGHWPIGDGANGADHVAELLTIAGYGSGDFVLEDPGIVLDYGTALEPRWQGEIATDLLSHLYHILDDGMSKATIWSEKGVIRTGCKFCRTTRTSADWQSHCDNGWLSSGCYSTISFYLHCLPSTIAGAYDSIRPDDYYDPNLPSPGCWPCFRLRPRLAAGSTDDYANFVAVIGEDANGKTIQRVMADYAEIGDPTSADYIGWPIMHVEASRGRTTEAAINQKALDLYQDRHSSTLWIEAECLFNPFLRVGMVVAVPPGHCSHYGADGQKYRITKLVHNITTQENAVRTTLTARWIGSI